MLLSVIVVTNRVGGLDVLEAGLRGQSFKDFELVVVDELAQERREGFVHAGKRTIVIGLNGAPRWGHYMRAQNLALRSSRGDALVFWSDYTCAHPDTLAHHAEFHRTHAATDVMLGAIDYTETPAVHPEFPGRYGWSAMGHDVANHRDDTYAPWLDDKRRHELYEEWRQNYERDLADGTLAPFMRSVFAEPLRDFSEAARLRVFQSNDRVAQPFLNLKNDSIRRELLLEGFDERADGTHGHQDSITAKRLAAMGAKFIPNPGAAVKVLDAHNIALIRRFAAGLRDDANLALLA